MRWGAEKKEKRIDVILYIHGKGGSAAEAEHNRQLYPSCDVIGLAYKGFTPWDAGKEIHETITGLKANYDRIILIANSIVAHFSMNADIERYVAHAYFISPIVDMEKLITDMMGLANVTEPDLQGRRIHCGV